MSNKRLKTDKSVDEAVAVARRGWETLGTAVACHVLSFLSVRDVVGFSTTSRMWAAIRTSAAYDAFWRNVYMHRFELESLEDADMQKQVQLNYQRLALRARIERNWFHGIYTKRLLTVTDAVAAATGDLHDVVLCGARLCFAMHAVDDNKQDESLHTLNLQTGVVTSQPQTLGDNHSEAVDFMRRLVHRRGIVTAYSFWYRLGETKGAERPVAIDTDAGERLNVHRLSEEGDRVLVWRTSSSLSDLFVYSLETMEKVATISNVPRRGALVTHDFAVFVDGNTFVCRTRQTGWTDGWTCTFDSASVTSYFICGPARTLLVVTSEPGLVLHRVDLTTGRRERMTSCPIDCSVALSGSCFTVNNDAGRHFSPRLFDLCARREHLWSETFAADYLDRNWRFCVLRPCSDAKTLIVLDFFVL